MLSINVVHHVAIICADYSVSKRFYTEVLGFAIIAETYRSERKSYKLDLKVNEHFQIELFSFPEPPLRGSRPEACGLRHIAFLSTDIHGDVASLQAFGVEVEPIRKDELTGKLFTFFADPDQLPIELYQK
jgi:glyoxylase I family protein